MTAYPQKEDIEAHKKELFTRLLNYYLGTLSFSSSLEAIRKLMGDAALWIDSRHHKFTKERMEEIKKEIHSLALSPQIKMTIKRPHNKTFTAYFLSKQDVKNFTYFIDTIIANATKKARR